MDDFHENFLFMSDYLLHRRAIKLSEPEPKPKKVYKIRSFSDKRAKLNQEYAVKSRPYWQGQMCAIRSPICTGKAQGIHHRKGKASPELLMDETWWMPACFMCNNYIEDKHKWAIEHGHKIQRNGIK